MKLSKVVGPPVTILLGGTAVLVDDRRVLVLTMDDATAGEMRRIAPLFFREWLVQRLIEDTA